MYSQGAVSGGTRLSISGSGFLNLGMEKIKVKFCAGKKEATVMANYVSSTLLTCITPSFEEHGPMEVVASVAFDADRYTVNRAVFAYFVNTKADKCLAVGSATLPTGRVGHNLVM